MEAVTVASSAFCPLSCWKCAGKGQRSVLTGLGVRVAVTLSAAVRWGLFVVLFLREAQGQRLGGAGTAIGLLLSKPAVSAALLRAVWEVKGHAALRLLKHTHTHKHTAVKLSRQWLQYLRKKQETSFWIFTPVHQSHSSGPAAVCVWKWKTFKMSYLLTVKSEQLHVILKMKCVIFESLVSPMESQHNENKAGKGKKKYLSLNFQFLFALNKYKKGSFNIVQ